MKRLVVSAINFSEGGPLTVLRDFLRAACALPAEWEIVALVHDRNLFDLPRVRFMEFRDSKSSWLRRLYYEYWHFRDLSREIGVDVWLSLHDISPRVVARRQVVYCHQPAPFYRMPLRGILEDPRYFLFTRFYRFLYGFNIRANDLVVVQQDWIRQQFRRMFGIGNVAVAYPVSHASEGRLVALAPGERRVLLYPALPRSFKNFDTLCQAAATVERTFGPDFEVRITVSGDENAYAARLRRQYGGIAAVRFIGRQTPQQMQAQYAEASAVVFPSLLETWGLPITEGKALGKVLMLADLPYAHEALGAYGRACFFDPQSPSALAALMLRHLSGEEVGTPHAGRAVAEPYAPDWAALVRMVADIPDERA